MTIRRFSAMELAGGPDAQSSDMFELDPPTRGPNRRKWRDAGPTTARRRNENRKPGKSRRRSKRY